MQSFIMSALNSVQLSIALKTNSVTSKHMSAVFARGELSSIYTNPPQIIIVNTDLWKKVENIDCSFISMRMDQWIFLVLWNMIFIFIILVLNNLFKNLLKTIKM